MRADTHTQLAHLTTQAATFFPRKTYNNYRRCERAGQYDVALRLLDEMRKKRMRFYDIGILDELFKRLLAGLSLFRGRRAAAVAARSPLPPPAPPSNTRSDGVGGGDGGGETW